jgi:transposase, IS30 family
MQLILWDLFTIKTLVSKGYINSEIARKIGRNRSVLARLFQKHDRDSFDPEEIIRERTETKRKNSLAYCRIHPWGELANYIEEQIQKGLSPDQVAGSWVRKQKEAGITERLSKDTVYEFIYCQVPELIKTCFRRKWSKYRDRKQEKAAWKYQIQERRMIDDRPKEIDERGRIGDWEWDTIIGKDHKWAILTLVERKTWYLMAYKLPQGKNAEWVTSAIQKLWSITPEKKRKTLTLDNGREFADHKMLEYFTKTIIYFAHPYHSWERGTNENTNWLLREYIPKKTDFSTITQEQLDIFVEKINLRPRKRLWYFTPHEMFHQVCCV